MFFFFGLRKSDSAPPRGGAREPTSYSGRADAETPCRRAAVLLSLAPGRPFYTRFVWRSGGLKACCRRNDAEVRGLATTSRTCHRFQSLLPAPELATTSRACYDIQSLL